MELKVSVLAVTPRLSNFSNPLHGVESSRPARSRNTDRNNMNPLHGVESVPQVFSFQWVGVLLNPLHGVESHGVRRMLEKKEVGGESITWS